MRHSINNTHKLLSLGLVIILVAWPSLRTVAATTRAVQQKAKISPDRIQGGKTRDVTITSDQDLKDIEPQAPPSGSGITFEAVSGQTVLHPNDKTILVRIKVDEDADRGTVPITLIKPADKTVFDVVNLEITDFRPTKIPRGPTPDDIKFEVDAMWNVVPYKIAKANFGRKAADAFYAVEVFIGNNSGFDLQIVGVGFESAHGGRTVDQFGRPLAFLTDDKGKVVTDEYGNKFIEAVDKYGQRILIDGKQTYRPFRKYQLPTSDHRLVRGTIELDQLYGRRAIVVNLIGGFGTLISGFIPFYHNANPRANFSTFSSILNGQLKEGFALAAPDLTVNQLNRLENVVLHDGLTVLNNSQAKTIVFFPRHLLGSGKEGKKDSDDGMWPVLEKLGELIIVGKPIVTYQNREIVATRSQPPVPAPTTSANAIGAPTVTGTTPDNHAPGDKITVIGTNFVPGSTVSFNGVAGTDATFISSTQISVTIPNEATSGPITVTTPSGSASGPNFVVKPRIEDIDRKTAPAGQAIIITGKNLDTVDVVKFGSVEVKKPFPTQEKEKIVVNVPTGAESDIILISKFGNATPPDTKKFVAESIISDFSPKQGKTGDKITITGKNLNDVQVFFGNTAADVVTPDATSIDVKVPKNAVSGPITVRNALGVEKKTAEDFTFIPAPVIVNFSINGGAPQTQATVKAGDQLVISGQNLKGAVVKIGDTTLSPQVEEGKITVTIPDVAPGKITIETPGGTLTPEKLTFVASPKVTTFTVNGHDAEPEPSVKAGDKVVISGENLATLTTVKFGGTAATFFNVGEKQFTVEVPQNLPAGKIKIEITTLGGTVSTEKFTITQ